MSLMLELLPVSTHVALMPASIARPAALRGELTILPLQVDDLLSETRCFWRGDDPTLALFRACLARAADQPRFSG